MVLVAPLELALKAEAERANGIVIVAYLLKLIYAQCIKRIYLWAQMIFFIFSVHFAYLCWDTLPGSLGMRIAADFSDSLPPPAGLVPLARELEGSKLMGPSWSKTSVILFSEGQNCDRMP